MAGAGSLLMLAASPGDAHARTARDGGSKRETGAARQSSISHGTRLVHADLHNHTLMSDGGGDPALAFASMRDAGLDVAALTDHATDNDAYGLSPKDWERIGKLADAADHPHHYTALRGFEWSHPMLGHVNVWGTEHYADLKKARDLPALFDWIKHSNGIGSFNHPGRELSRFHEFKFDKRLLDQMVGLEMFNQRTDFLFHGWSQGRPSPLTACLNAGWRTGITGVTDEHGNDWGRTEGKGRAGLWVTDNTRHGVLAAMRARRFFATRVSGLRLDALAAGVRMGGRLPFAKRDVKFAVDLDRGRQWHGKKLHVQVLRPGTKAPDVVDVIETESGKVTEFTVPLDIEDGPWVVLRISDPTQVNATPGPHRHLCNDFGVAYSSPWWLTKT
jgi:hypothetical protein